MGHTVRMTFSWEAWYEQQTDRQANSCAPDTALSPLLCQHRRTDGGQGPLAKYFDELCDDSFFGEKTWEKAEATMQRRVLRRALEQAGLKPGDVDYVLAGTC